MTAPLEGWSAGARLQAAQALKGLLLEDVAICPECPDYPISAVSCEARAMQWLLSGRHRPHICIGERCGHWPAGVTDRIRDSQAVQTVMEDRSKPVQYKGPRVTKEGSMSRLSTEQRLALLRERYPNHPPVPEGARISALDYLYQNRRQLTPCPQCQAAWKGAVSQTCRACQGKDHGAERAAMMRQAKAAKKIIGLSPAKIRAQKLELLAAKAPAAPATKRPAARTASPPFMPLPGNPVETAICEACGAMAEMLITKNRAYGNSVFMPVAIFAKGDPEELINVRIDDKLSRLMRGKEAAGEDAEMDLCGYLLLKRAWRRLRPEAQP